MDAHSRALFLGTLDKALTAPTISLLYISGRTKFKKDSSKGFWVVLCIFLEIISYILQYTHFERKYPCIILTLHSLHFF